MSDIMATVIASIIFLLLCLLVELFFYLLVLGSTLFTALITYILEGLSIMKISKKLDIPRGWLAFIPLASAYQLGKIAEKDDEVYDPTGSHLKWSKIMLAGEICCVAVMAMVHLVLLFFGILFACLFTAVVVISAETGLPPDQFPLIIMVMYISCLLVAGITNIVAICYNVLLYIVYYKVFHVMVEDNAWWILLIMILTTPFAAIVAFLIFAFSKKFPIYQRTAAEKRTETPITEE